MVDEPSATAARRGPPGRKPPFTLAAPPPSDLPTSGGALRGMGQQVRCGGPTGSATLRLPLALSPCRHGKEPTLNLTYDSGQPQGPFGIGWSLDLPMISRRTDKGLPRYADADDADVFLLSGEQDLVQVLTETPGGWVPVPVYADGFRIDRYAPRVEGSFARIERLTDTTTGDTHWRVISADNLTRLFGLTSDARVTDPDDPLKVAEWRIEAQFDACGNACRFDYKREDLAGVSRSDVAEAMRLATVPANRYLKRIRYGNTAPLATRAPRAADLAGLGFLFEAVCDYGEHTSSLPDEVVPWPARSDPFSTYRYGFEVRTYRLCRRLLMFHTMPADLGAPARLVRSVEFGFDENPVVTYLLSVEAIGHDWTQAGDAARERSPTLVLDYSRADAFSTRIVSAAGDALAQAPVGVDGHAHQFVDLDGEGLPGILVPTAAGTPALYYKRNLGGGNFARAERLELQPSLPMLGTAGSAQAQLLSLNGDGRLDLVWLSGSTRGFFERTDAGAWSPFVPFRQLPSVDPEARGVHFIDLDGDGIADLLIAADQVFVWHEGLGRDGFAAGRRTSSTLDRATAATMLTTDDAETIFVADMSGDGLGDIVRVRNGQVCYWPNLGYGRFGGRIVMRGSPVFDHADLFDPTRVRLGDIDGSGPTDIVYLSRAGAMIYRNEAGNGWSSPVAIPLPLADALATVRIADLLGTGTACLVWSSPEPAAAGNPLRYVDLLASTKPHLLRTIDDGMGALMTIAYASSAHFYLEDRHAGRPWATTPPFVIQTVAQVTIDDRISTAATTTRYRYAHGYYDGVEREFRGFARVDSWDAVALSDDHGIGLLSAGLPDHDGRLVPPPSHVVEWYHVGAWREGGDRLHAALATEFFQLDPLAPASVAPSMPTGTDPAMRREAYRSLKGLSIRREVYADDAGPEAALPFSVVEHRYAVRLVQPRAGSRHAICHATRRETVDSTYERRTADPRVRHTLTLETDALGHVLRSAEVAYARRAPAEPEQAVTLATVTRATFAPPLDAAADFRHGLPVASETFELAVPPGAAVLDFAVVDALMTAAVVLPFDAATAAGTMRRTEHVRHQYWRDDLSAPLAIGSGGALALPYAQFALAAPASLIADVFGATVGAADMVAKGYLAIGGDYWTTSGVTTYAAAALCQPVAFTDPFGNTASVVYDAHKLLIVERHSSQDPAFDNVTVTRFDYRTLQPDLVTDPAGAQTGFAYGPQGDVIAIARMGRPGHGEGDTLADPTTRVSYDRRAWQIGGTPPGTHTWQRLRHGAANPGWLEHRTFFDGMGREVLTKRQAAPDAGQLRWIGTGRTIFDAKGNPIKTYEAYFATSSDFDDEAALATVAFGEVRQFDALSRRVRTDFPNGTFETSHWDAWTRTHSDRVDTVLASRWFADASVLPPGDPLARAALLAAQSANTPETARLDPLGREVVVIADNGPAGLIAVRSQLDISGRVTRITDALGHVPLDQRYDASGGVLSTAGCDAAPTLTLTDGSGTAWLAIDPRGYRIETRSDPLRRPVEIAVTPPGGARFIAERFVYGEGLADPAFRGRLYHHFDSGGVATAAAYDFTGRITRAERRLAAIFDATPSWDAIAAVVDPALVLGAAQASLEGDVFTIRSSFDALGRLVEQVLPDATRFALTYDAGGRLAAMTTTPQGIGPDVPVVASIAYDAHGQRLSTRYGTGVVATYAYDDRTHRTRHIQIMRESDHSVLQDLSFTYDPMDNLVETDDAAQQTVYFAANVTTGLRQYTYDAVYQLTRATGREQPGQVGFVPGPGGYPEAAIGHIPGRNDLQALIAFAETYDYDAAGNLIATRHLAGAASWTRHQTCLPGSNRIDRVARPADPAGGPYSGQHQTDAAGYIVAMPHLGAMTWDHAGRLIKVDLLGGGTAFFTYDADGRRLRKIVVRANQTIERVYVGSYERFRTYAGGVDPALTTSERLTAIAGDGDRAFAIVDTRTVGGPAAPLFRLQFADLVHSACVVTDLSGDVVSYEEYFPFGSSAYRAGDIDKRYRFIGRERDEETGFCYCAKRYLAPWLSRWISLDPLGSQRRHNRYVYADNRPTSLTDPGGMEPGNDDRPTPPPSPTLVERARAATNPGTFRLDPSLAALDPNLGRPGTLPGTGPRLQLTPPAFNFGAAFASAASSTTATDASDAAPSAAVAAEPPPAAPVPPYSLGRAIVQGLASPFIATGRFFGGFDYRLATIGPVAAAAHSSGVGTGALLGLGMYRTLQSGGRVTIGAGVLAGDSGIGISAIEGIPADQAHVGASPGFYRWLEPGPVAGVSATYVPPGSRQSFRLGIGFTPSASYNPYSDASPHATGAAGAVGDFLLDSALHYNHNLKAGSFGGVILEWHL